MGEVVVTLRISVPTPVHVEIAVLVVSVEDEDMACTSGGDVSSGNDDGPSMDEVIIEGVLPVGKQATGKLLDGCATVAVVQIVGKHIAPVHVIGGQILQLNTERLCGVTAGLGHPDRVFVVPHHLCYCNSGASAARRLLAIVCGVEVVVRSVVAVIGGQERLHRIFGKGHGLSHTCGVLHLPHCAVGFAEAKFFCQLTVTVEECLQAVGDVVGVDVSLVGIAKDGVEQIVAGYDDKSLLVGGIENVIRLVARVTIGRGLEHPALIQIQGKTFFLNKRLCFQQSSLPVDGCSEHACRKSKQER